MTYDRNRWPFTCGTRTVVYDHEKHCWRVVCATCGRGGTVPHGFHDDATKAAVRDSNKPCPCGAR